MPQPLCRGNESGFVVNNVHVNGSIVAYGSVWMMWRVTTPQDVTPDSLALLNVTKPVPDLLVFGSGAIRQQPPAATLQMLRTHNIGLEALPTVRYSHKDTRALLQSQHL
jgi:uncharacterized protein